MVIDNLEVLIESFKNTHSKHDKMDSVVDALSYLYRSQQVMESATTATEYCNAKYMHERMIGILKESINKENTFVWPYSVAPYFTPEEVVQFKDYYSESCRTIGDKSIFYDLEYLEDQLRNTEDPNEIGHIKAEIERLSHYSGEAEDLLEVSGTQFEPRSWNKKVTTLITQLKMEEDPKQIDYIKQQLLDLGWNPEIDYTVENQIKAKKRIESIYQEKYKNIFTLDITSLVEASDINEEIISEGYNDNIRPIHVVLIKGDAGFSDVIATVTQSHFSHSAICIDNDFNNLYSFNLLNGVNKAGGFSIERIDDYPKENRLAIFTFFVHKKDHDKIVKRIKMLANNIDKTTYSIANILMMPFKNVNLNLDNSMICSQFVDSILKMANIDITGKDSSKVVPNDFYKATTIKGKVYKVFDGVTKDFKPKKVIAYVNKMSRKVKPAIAEGLNNLLDDYIYPTLMEAKLPIQFNKDGDVLLTNPLVDFDREYSASHKLLIQYAKVGNSEGMKYELARLYYMNYVLEHRLYHNNSLSNKEKNIKTRARVLNDFNKYIKYVLEKEPGFNFSEYYEKSIFYPHTVEVKKHTLLKLKDVIKHILLY